MLYCIKEFSSDTPKLYQSCPDRDWKIYSTLKNIPMEIINHSGESSFAVNWGFVTVTENEGPVHNIGHHHIFDTQRII